MKCNYKRNQNNSIPRWAVTVVDGKLKKVPVSEEEYIRGYFEQYGVEIVTPKDKLINALKQGDYVIGIDYNPFVLQDVFHYSKTAVYRWINRGWLKSVYLFGKYLIPKKELLEFLTSPNCTTLPQKSLKHLQHISDIKRQMQLQL